MVRHVFSLLVFAVFVFSFVWAEPNQRSASAVFAESPLLTEASQSPVFYVQSGPFDGILLDTLGAIPQDRRKNFLSHANENIFKSPYLLGSYRDEWAQTPTVNKSQINFTIGNEVGDPLFNELNAPGVVSNKTPFLGLSGTLKGAQFEGYFKLDQNDHWGSPRTRELKSRVGFVENSKKYNPEKAKAWFGENLPSLSLFKSGVVFYDSSQRVWQFHAQDGWMWLDKMSGEAQLFRIHQWNTFFAFSPSLNVSYVGQNITEELSQKSTNISQIDVNKVIRAFDQRWILSAYIFQASRNVDYVFGVENKRPFVLWGQNQSDSSNELSTLIQFGNHYYHAMNELKQHVVLSKNSQIDVGLKGEFANQIHPFQNLSQKWLNNSSENDPQKLWKKWQGTIQYSREYLNYKVLPWRYWGLRFYQADSFYVLGNSFYRQGTQSALVNSVGSVEQELEIHWPQKWSPSQNAPQTSDLMWNMSLKGMWQPHFERAWNDVDFLPPVYRGQFQADIFLPTDLTISSRIHIGSPTYLRGWSENSIRYQSVPQLSFFLKQNLLKGRLVAQIAALNILSFDESYSESQSPNGAPNCFRLLTGIQAGF
jgi:hypothetical protein